MCFTLLNLRQLQEIKSQCLKEMEVKKQNEIINSKIDLLIEVSITNMRCLKPWNRLHRDWKDNGLAFKMTITEISKGIS